MHLKKRKNMEKSCSFCKSFIVPECIPSLDSHCSSAVSFAILFTTSGLLEGSVILTVDG